MFHHMLKKTFLVITGLWVCSVAYGVELKPAEVRSAVTTWVRQATADSRPDAEIVDLEPYLVDGRTAAYIAFLSSGGYALCGADDRLLPVYLYSAETPYDSTDPGIRAILQDIGRRLLAFEQADVTRDPVQEEYAEGLAERAAMWSSLQAGHVPALSGTRSTPSYMALPVTDKWRQGAPYNHACPVLTPGTEEHVVVGCVATAMSEIMYYWKWPLTGEGTGSTTYHYRYSDGWIAVPLSQDPGIPPDWAGGNRLFYHPIEMGLAMNGYWDGSIYYDGAMHLTDDANGDPDPEYINALESLWGFMQQDTRSCLANFGASSFDWSQMDDVHTSPYGTEDQEVAWLCYCVGVSVEMGYGVWGSGASTSSAAEAYSDHFRYDPAAVVYSRSISNMINEIQWLRPVQLAGYDDGGGHSFVVCGYNDSVSPTQFLINKGWGDGATSWLTLDSFYPDDQYHVIQIAPLSVVRFVGGLVGGTGTPDHPYVTLNTAFADAPDGTTLIMKAGSTHDLPSNGGVLSRPMILKGQHVVIDK